MNLPAHLGLRHVAVALLCLAAAITWTIREARMNLRSEVEISADRIAALFARQPGLGSAGPAATTAVAPQAAPAVLSILPGICAETRLATEAPRRFCGDWDGLDAAPRWFVTELFEGTEPGRTIRDIVYRGRAVGSVLAWSDPNAAATRLWRQVRVAGGLAVTLAAAMALLGWFAAVRLVAPASRIVRGLENLDAVAPSPPLPRFATAEFDRIAVAFNDLAGRLTRSEAERAGLMQRFVSVQEEERQALARDLHDAFGQCLAAVGARAAAIEFSAPQHREDLREDARGIEAVVAGMRDSLRGALARLELPDLAEVGPVDALRGLVADWRMQFREGPVLHFDVAGDFASLPPSTSISLYRIAQELVTNAVRHGRPSRIFLRLDRAGGGARTTTLTVDDDGGGDVSCMDARVGRGLTGIRARLAALGGSLSLVGTGSGIRARATVPTT